MALFGTNSTKREELVNDLYYKLYLSSFQAFDSAVVMFQLLAQLISSDRIERDRATQLLTICRAKVELISNVAADIAEGRPDFFGNRSDAEFGEMKFSCDLFFSSLDAYESYLETLDEDSLKEAQGIMEGVVSYIKIFSEALSQA